MIYIFKCRVCEFRFPYTEGEEFLCPRCRAKYIKKTSKKNVKIAKRSKYTGPFVKIEKKRCQKCIHSEETATSAVKCTLPTPEVIFHGEKKVWICYSFQKMKMR